MVAVGTMKKIISAESEHYTEGPLVSESTQKWKDSTLKCLSSDSRLKNKKVPLKSLVDTLARVKQSLASSMRPNQLRKVQVHS